ncbi:MAG TPA: hypothetical protein VM658_17460, partial [bacterium]|nr:hypothetical protein [bacterium]
QDAKSAKDCQANHDISWRPNKKQLQGSDPKPTWRTARRERQAENTRTQALLKSCLKIILGALGVLAVLRSVYFGQH